MDSKIKELRRTSAAASQKVIAALAAEVEVGRFAINTRNSVKLAKSLGVSNKRDLVGRTLLTPSVHSNHAEKLADRFLRQLDRLNVAALKKGRGVAQHAAKASVKDHIRFFTLLDSLVLVDEKLILEACHQMRKDIHKAVAETSGLWLLGCIEVEIVNMHMMRRIKNHGAMIESEMRKLDVLEVMAKRLGKKGLDAASLALVHFHGIVTTADASQFDALRTQCNKNARWRKAGRQIQLKPLSDQFGGRRKSVELSLRDISKYITKGGNDWIGGKAYLRYKIGFDNNDVPDEDIWIQKNYRRNEQLKLEIIHEGIEDALSMTGHDIATLASVIDSLMGLNNNRTGYLINAKSGAHSRALST